MCVCVGGLWVYLFCTDSNTLYARMEFRLNLPQNGINFRRIALTVLLSQMTVCQSRYYRLQCYWFLSAVSFRTIVYPSLSFVVCNMYGFHCEYLCIAICVFFFCFFSSFSLSFCHFFCSKFLFLRFFFGVCEFICGSEVGSTFPKGLSSRWMYGLSFMLVLLRIIVSIHIIAERKK